MQNTSDPPKRVKMLKVPGNAINCIYLNSRQAHDFLVDSLFEFETIVLGDLLLLGGSKPKPLFPCPVKRFFQNDARVCWGMNGSKLHSNPQELVCLKNIFEGFLEIAQWPVTVF